MGIFSKSEPSGTAPVIKAGAQQPGPNNAHGRPITPEPVPGTPAQAETAKGQPAQSNAAQPNAAKPVETRKV